MIRRGAYDGEFTNVLSDARSNAKVTGPRLADAIRNTSWLVTGTNLAVPAVTELAAELDITHTGLYYAAQRFRHGVPNPVGELVAATLGAKNWKEFRGFLVELPTAQSLATSFDLRTEDGRTSVANHLLINNSAEDVATFAAQLGQVAAQPAAD